MHSITAALLPPIFSILLSFPTSTLSSPTPTGVYSAPSTFSPCQAAHDNTNNTYEIREFLTFQSAPTSTTEQIHTLSFHLFDPLTSVSATCSRSLSAADIAAGANLTDPLFYQTCDDPAVSFAWDGRRLTLLESWNCSGIIGILGGHVDFFISCFAMKPSYVRGEGTLCELMADSIVGKYTTIWDDTGYYVYGLGPDGVPL